MGAAGKQQHDPQNCKGSPNSPDACLWSPVTLTVASPITRPQSSAVGRTLLYATSSSSYLEQPVGSLLEISHHQPLIIARLWRLCRSLQDGVWEVFKILGHVLKRAQMSPVLHRPVRCRKLTQSRQRTSTTEWMQWLQPCPHQLNII